MRCLAFLSAGFAALLVGLFALAPQSQALDIAPKIEQCLQGTNKLSVVMLVDESKSLQETDPANDRVTGLKSVLAALSQAVEDKTSNRNLDAEVLFAGFYGDTHPKPEDTVDGSGWLPLNGGNLGELLGRADQYASMNNAPQTDHAYALENARQLLTQRAAERSADGEGAPCNLIVFFTDGAYFISERGQGKSALATTVPYAPSLDLTDPANAAKAVERGKQYLCDANKGLITQMGRDGTVLLTVALAPKQGLDRNERLDGERKAFLKSLSTGTDHCGNVPGGIGDYVEAGTGTQLFFRFNDSLTGNTSKLTPLKPCDGQDCLEGGNPFDAIKGEKSFQLLADIGKGGTGIRFVSPSGQKITIPANDSDTVEENGITLKPLWITKSVVRIDGDFDTSLDEWVGGWNVALTGTAEGALHSLTFEADLSPVLVSEPVLTRGEVTSVRFRLDNADGEALNPNPVTDMIEPKARFHGPDPRLDKVLTVQGPTASLELKSDVEIKVDNSSGTGDIGLTLDFNSPAGHQIEPVYQPFTFEVKLPDSLGYPSVTPAELNLGSITGVGETSGVVTLEGTANGGCVWLESSKSEAPDEVGEVSVTTQPAADGPDSCIPLDKGETKTMNVKVSPAGEADGTVDVELKFGLKSSVKPTENQVSSVHASFPIAAEPNVAARALILIVLIVVGALLPVLLLHFLNRLGAKFSAPQSVQYLRQPIRINLGDSPSVTADGVGPIITEYDQFQPVSSSGSEARVRELAFQGLLEFRTVASISRDPRLLTFLRGPVGMIRRLDGGKVVAGASAPLDDWHENTWQEVPLELPGTWVFEPQRVERDDSMATEMESSHSDVTAVVGTLTMLIHFGGSIEQGAELFEKAARQLPGLAWNDLASPVSSGLGERRKGFVAKLRDRLHKDGPPKLPVNTAPTASRGEDDSDPFRDDDLIGGGLEGPGSPDTTTSDDPFSESSSGRSDSFGAGSFQKSTQSGGSSEPTFGSEAGSADDPFNDDNETW